VSGPTGFRQGHVPSPTVDPEAAGDGILSPGLQGNKKFLIARHQRRPVCRMDNINGWRTMALEKLVGDPRQGDPVQGGW
jgi:hypothetical protein